MSILELFAGFSILIQKDPSLVKRADARVHNFFCFLSTVQHGSRVSTNVIRKVKSRSILKWKDCINYLLNVYQTCSCEKEFTIAYTLFIVVHGIIDIDNNNSRFFTDNSYKQ